MPLPKHPSFSYYDKMKCYELKDDQGLLDMFSRYAGIKEIDVWFGCSTSPSDVLLMARQLRANNCSHIVRALVDNDQISDVFENIEVEPITIISDAVDHSGREKLQIRRTIKPSSHSSLSPRINSRVNSCHDDNPTIRISTISLSLSPKKSTRLSLGNDHVITQQQFKMPNTTRKRKGVCIPRKSKENVGVVGSSNKRVTRSSTKDLLSSEGVVVTSDSEGSYEPSDDDFIDDDDGMTDLEEEDNLIISSLDMIDDGYIPFRGNEWSTEDEGYYVKLYGNGEMYDNKEFGAIVLRLWMLFMDKDHFRVVQETIASKKDFM
ncbi:hypothetical protein RND81_10G093600 [Saponaria officinalis]|uniref:Uncharacterized protein n=1 Tax=Saponaria officinalis TaxID=3572 RepID=A0AAW1I2C8_SAPOF